MSSTDPKALHAVVSFAVFLEYRQRRENALGARQPGRYQRDPNIEAVGLMTTTIRVDGETVTGDGETGRSPLGAATSVVAPVRHEPTVRRPV